MSHEANITFSFSYQGEKKIALIQILRAAAGTKKDASGTESSVLGLVKAKDLVEASFNRAGGPSLTMTQAQFGRFMALILMSDRVNLPEVRIIGLRETFPYTDPYDLTK